MIQKAIVIAEKGSKIIFATEPKKVPGAKKMVDSLVIIRNAQMLNTVKAFT
jgi:hypothetical protein